MNLKRLWDTENKKIVWAIPTNEPHKKLQVWTNDDGSKLYVYDSSKYIELNLSNATAETYGPVWKQLEDEEVGYYLTNEPTDLYSRDQGDEASYQFVDYDGTILKSGKVDEGQTPTAPADPTREATAQYTYTFAGWNPEVGPITKKTTYTATYSKTVNEYTITWKDGDDNTLDTDTVAYGSTPEYTGENPTKEDTDQYTYDWDGGWSPSVVAVTGDATYTATFTATVKDYEVTVTSDDETMGTVDVENLQAYYGDSISAVSNVLTIGETEITATAESGYVFSAWTDGNGDPLPATISGELSVIAVFEAEQE